MQYKLTRIDPDAPGNRYPMGERELVDDPLAGQVHRNVFMGRLEQVLHHQHHALVVVDIDLALATAQHAGGGRAPRRAGP